MKIRTKKYGETSENKYKEISENKCKKISGNKYRVNHQVSQVKVVISPGYFTWIFRRTFLCSLIIVMAMTLYKF